MGAVNGKVVFITGGARGIGADIARRLRAKGARLVLTDIDADPLAALAGELGADHVLTAVADVRDLEAMQSVANEAVERFAHAEPFTTVCHALPTGALPRHGDTPDARRDRRSPGLRGHARTTADTADANCDVHYTAAAGGKPGGAPGRSRPSCGGPADGPARAARLPERREVGVNTAAEVSRRSAKFSPPALGPQVVPSQLVSTVPPPIGTLSGRNRDASNPSLLQLRGFRDDRDVRDAFGAPQTPKRPPRS